MLGFVLSRVYSVCSVYSAWGFCGGSGRPSKQVETLGIAVVTVFYLLSYQERFRVQGESAISRGLFKIKGLGFRFR